MSLTDNGNNGMVMPVSPMYGGGGNGSGTKIMKELEKLPIRDK